MQVGLKHGTTVFRQAAMQTLVFLANAQPKLHIPLHQPDCACARVEQHVPGSTRPHLPPLGLLQPYHATQVAVEAVVRGDSHEDDEEGPGETHTRTRMIV